MTADPQGREGRARGRRRHGEKGSPEPVGRLVSSLLERWGVAHKVERARAVSDWERVAGPHIARVTGDVKVRGRALIVEVENSSWLYELNMRRRDLLERLNEGASPRARIEKIVFVQADGAREDRDR